ncbi:MAG: 4Fe-4S binding protein, partial [Candidatus Lokiarchaeota archaeon]|nr:4Fe-4S binding protein [Candidatus Lokiarchaeota archaeon]
LSDENAVMVSESKCTGCDVCVSICPSEAIKKKT